MLLWFTILTIVVSVVAAVLCLVLGFAGRRPSDVSVGALAVVELVLIAQVVIAIVAPFVGNPPTGDLLEYWTYLITALFIPVGAVVWAFIERGRWSTVILGVAAIAIAIMTWRMHVIWTIQVA